MALGHAWKLLRAVTTEYDDTGSLIQKGYTIYECSRCGEQYKSEDSTGPPGGSGPTTPGEDKESIWDKTGKLLGSIGGGILEIIGALAGKLFNALVSLAEMIAGKLAAVVELALGTTDLIPAHVLAANPYTPIKSVVP